MLQEMIQTPEQLSIHECMSSPLSDQILNFKYDEDFFEEAIGEPKIPSPTTNTITAASTAATPATTADITSPEPVDEISLLCYDNTFASAFSNFDSSDILSELLDNQPPPEPEPDILLPSSMGAPLLPMLPMSPPYPPNPASQLDEMMASANGFASYLPDSMAGQMPLTMSGYLGLEQPALRPCPFLGGGDFYTDGMGAQACGGDSEMGLFGRGRRLMGLPEVRAGPADACGGISMYAPGPMHMFYSSGDLQVLGDGQHLAGRCGINGPAIPRASDVPTMDESSYKVGRLSVEERKEKIHRYLKKRNERNFSKKIKYACRKTLADSRPRVRGRFAKNDEFGEVTPRPNSVPHEYGDDDELVVKHEGDMLESSDILAHISGVNSLTYNYTVESWI